MKGMFKLVRGCIALSEKEKEIFNSDDKVHFDCDDKIKNKKYEMHEKELNDWALLLNSPWSQSDLHYEIEVNCKNGYEEMPEGTPEWRCRYYTIGYDAIYASCIGYGNTEEEALADCKKLLEYLQKTYNPEDESI